MCIGPYGDGGGDGVTVREILDMADELASNALPLRTKIFEFNRLEQRIRCDVLGEDPNEAELLTEETLPAAAPVLPSRYRDVYLYWMAAMIYFHQGESEAYENERQMFEAAWLRFERDVCIAIDGGESAASSLREGVGEAAVSVQTEHASISDAPASVPLLAAFETRIEADAGYTLEGCVAVTMGGTDVSEHFRNGVLRIERVTGDLTIRAMAEQDPAAWENLVDALSIAEGYAINPETGGERYAAGYVTVGESASQRDFIRLRAGNVLRVRGITMPALAAQAAAALYREDGSFDRSGSLTQSTTEWGGLAWQISGDRITALALQDCRLRICGPCADLSAVVVTVNREIN